MRKYVSVVRPRAMFDGTDDHWHIANVTATTVYELDANSTDTGLLDVRGNKIRALECREPIGFILLKDAV